MIFAIEDEEITMFIAMVGCGIMVGNVQVLLREWI